MGNGGGARLNIMSFEGNGAVGRGGATQYLSTFNNFF